MIEKGKISALQMGMILYVIVLATSILSLPAVAVKDAKQDLWLSPIWTSKLKKLNIIFGLVKRMN